MTSAPAFLDALAGVGVRFVSGVPCSYFSAPLQLIDAHPDLTYVPAANEGGALAAAAGAQLAGTGSAVLIQNSGFGNLINPLTSLLLPYRIPVLIAMSMRGWPAATTGEPQHRIMGQVVPSWLRTIDVPFAELTAGGPQVTDVVGRAAERLAQGSPVVLLVGKGAIEAAPAADAPPAGITSTTLISSVLEHLRSDEPVLSTTGYLSRALFQAGDRPGNFYMQGSMGHVAAVALGVALQNPAQRVVALDGDGAALMHLGTFAAVGGSAPPNLVHIVFNNGGYESTGGQPVPATVDFAAVAAACGYRTTLTVDDEPGLRDAVMHALSAPGPVLLTVRGVPGGAAGGQRASEGITVDAIATRFRARLTGHDRHQSQRSDR
ncbi:phosphonopyruvate decarboxylase [Actinoplanes sp. HUAS TT8]|uniref:phosphonopyruvate decarboxylase n=1 Tax=Actinoplanes sp. HUAS TT8 TaxID=3447453 RepID=UPI003F527D71